MPDLALLGGPRAIPEPATELFRWSDVTPDHEAAILDVLHRGAMSGTDVTRQFEREYAAWQGQAHAVAFNTGTAAIHAAMWAVGLRAGDEVVAQSITYWASILPAMSLGAVPVLVDIDPDTLCIDPTKIEARIGPHTRAIVVTHNMGYPTDMDAVMAIARRHGLTVIEDVSHAHGGLYKGRKLGTIGDVAAFSCMSGKSFPIGEGGVLTTDNSGIYERALAFAHYERYDDAITDPELAPYRGLPLGGVKYRMHQMSSALGRVQLRSYDARVAGIQAAMNEFWDLLEGVPGVRAHRVDPSSGSTMGGWYNPKGLYVAEELGGLSVTRFTAAVRAEGIDCRPGLPYKPLHLHPLFHTADVYGHGRPSRLAHAHRDVRERRGDLPVAEAVGTRTFGVPWFRNHDRKTIARYAAAFRKVAAGHLALLADDPGNPSGLADWRNEPMI
jgi:dTDP-4-amino-4,6-dideoxygalactose transaminase